MQSLSWPEHVVGGHKGVCVGVGRHYPKKKQPSQVTPQPSINQMECQSAAVPKLPPPLHCIHNTLMQLYMGEAEVKCGGVQVLL